MSQWKVSKEKIELFTHPNADALLIGKVGSYQVVVQKGLYNDGDEVVFAPEKSVLTGDIKIRAPPGTRNELIICTSEILRNKLVKASGVAQGMDPCKLAPDGGGQLQGLLPCKLLLNVACQLLKESAEDVHWNVSALGFFLLQAILV